MLICLILFESPWLPKYLKIVTNETARL